MGFKKAKKRYRLTFEDPELAGLEVIMGSMSIGQMLDFQKVVNALQPGEKKDEAVQQKMVELTLERFAKSIISWNLEDEEGMPIPATLAGVQTQELDFIMPIITAWQEAIAGVDPKSQPSANGSGNFPEVSLPMETLSASLPN